MDNFLFLLVNFTFLYPLSMTILWLSSGLYYYFHWEKNDLKLPPPLSYYPGVSIIVPCHNESNNIRQTLQYLDKQQYPRFEIIAVNDASTDDTGNVLNELAKNNLRLRVLHLTSNQGKAKGLNLAALISRFEYLLCVDADVSLDPNAIPWMIRHFINSPRVGAVSGNPRVATRSTLLGKIQVGEFSSIIGMIKRGQRILGRVFTVTGAVAMFRKAALQRIGYWRSDTATEDIDVSWRLQLDYWDVRYEPKALCWVLMPETFKGLLSQRIRWAQGGAQVLLRYTQQALVWKRRRMWPIYLESLVSIVWAYTIFTILILTIIGALLNYSAFQKLGVPMPTELGLMLSVFCLFQFLGGLFLDSKYEKKIGRYAYWLIWYPLFFWILQVIATVIGVPKGILRRKEKTATWKSPDRGIQSLYEGNIK